MELLKHKTLKQCIWLYLLVLTLTTIVSGQATQQSILDGLVELVKTDVYRQIKQDLETLVKRQVAEELESIKDANMMLLSDMDTLRLSLSSIESKYVKQYNGFLELVAKFKQHKTYINSIQEKYVKINETVTDLQKCSSCNQVPFWERWSPYGPCSVSCGNGIKVRNRSCNSGNSGDQGCEGEAEETTACGKGRCPHWGEWSPYSSCSVTCGEGTKRKVRACVDGVAGISGCRGESEKIMSCNVSKCPGYRPWQTWGACSASCGTGTSLRQRQCFNPTGGNCTGPNTERRQCDSGRECYFWADWLAWSHCSMSCGDGLQTRIRVCIGENCPGDKRDTRSCYTDCHRWSQWSVYSDCSVTCGVGIRNRKRTCLTGNDCQGPDSDTQTCRLSSCVPGNSREFENVALHKRATQSSTKPNCQTARAGSAVDGKTEPEADTCEEGCTATDGFYESDNWWMVNLESYYSIGYIVIFNRLGSFQKLNNFNVSVGNSSDITQHSICHFYNGTVASSENVTIECDRSMTGRYVSIQRTNSDSGGYLHLCEVQVFAEKVDCRNDTDICFVIDSSGSINEKVSEGYSLIKNFLIEIINSLNVSKDGVHIGVVRFSDLASLQWGLDRYNTKKEQIQAVRRMGYVGGFTNTQRGLELMRTRCFVEPPVKGNQEIAGDRGWAPNIAVVITDGASNVNEAMTIPLANRAKGNGIRIVTVGITREVNEPELTAVASDPRRDVLLVSDLSLLRWTLDEFLLTLCMP